MVIEELHKEIDRRWDRHLRETRKILRVPSVSMTGEGIEETAGLVQGLLDRLGAKTGQYRATKKSHPLVYGHLDVDAEKTALLYGMYDVQPVGNIEEWDHPPFGATIANKKPFGEVLINRGVENSKGALVGMLLAIETMVDKGEMPLNMHFLMEGEEELGGLSLPRYVMRNKQKLRKAEAAFSFDYNEDANGTPVISLGVKGCVYFDLIVEGSPQNGGPVNGEIHSSDAVWVHSPVWRLIKAIETFVDENQDPAIDGLWDDVVGPDREDAQLLRRLARRFDPTKYQKEIGVKRFKIGGTKEEMLKKYMFEPSLNVAGLVSGYTEEGSKTVLPARAEAKIDIRLVPNMTIEDTRRKVREHLRRRGFTDIKIRNYVDYPWSKVAVEEPINQACIEAMRYHGKDPEIWPISAGSAPMYLFDQVLGLPWGGVGLGYGEKAHAPNEFAVVRGMRDYEKSVITVFWKYAEMASRLRRHRDPSD